MSRLSLVAGAVAFALVMGHAAAAPSREKTIDAGTLDASASIREWSGKRLSLADVNGDGTLDILAQNANKKVYAIDAATGRAIAEVEPTYPYGPDLGPFNGPKAGDLDGDGTMELVNVNRAAVVSVWTLPRDGAPELQWEKHLNAHHGHPTADAGPVLADLDGDGKTLEILAMTEERGAFALRHDGTVLWTVDEYGGNAEPLALDVDGDGDLDAVFFTDGGVVYAIDGATGDSLWRFASRNQGVWPASVVSSGFASDIDADGRTEVVFCVRNVENATTDYAPGRPSYRQHHFVLFAIRDGKLLWKAKPSWGNPLCSAYPMPIDVDGDGKQEIVGMDWNTIGHKPGDWERTGAAHVFAYTHDGREMWHTSVNPFNAKSPIGLADWNADGRTDVIAYDDGGLVILDARDGRQMTRVSLSNGWTLKQGPVVADLDHDGTLEAVIAVEGGSDAILVYDLGTIAMPSWPGWEPPVPCPTPCTATPPTSPTPPTNATPTPTTTPTDPTDPTPPTGPLEENAARAIPWGGALLAVAAAAASRARKR